MNKYIKKCLLIYISMAVILCGMVGVTYAITATDADQYVTRSQYAVDMAYLQNKLDEKEAGLMGSINRYRSTDVKLTLWDTPDRYFNSNSNNWAGYHTGGNFFPLKKMHNSGGIHKSFGPYAKFYDRAQSNNYIPMYLHRLWNGNYYIGPGLALKTSMSDDSAQEYYETKICAVPVESHPGWYMVLHAYMQEYYYIGWHMSLVKLDPTVPMPNNTELADMKNNQWLTIRLKKDLWDYCGDNTTKLTTNVSNVSASSYYTTNMAYRSSLVPNIFSDNTGSYGTGMTINWRGWVEEETGDYMLQCKNVWPTSGWAGDVVHYYGGANCILNRFIPKDNVEYMMGNTNNNVGYNPTSNFAVPDARYIGTGAGDDPTWTYEFVECDNGIKYWHATRAPKTTSSQFTLPVPYTYHYSLPIVY